MDAGFVLNENNGRNAHARTGVFAAVPFSPEGAEYESPGQHPGEAYRNERRSPEGAKFRLARTSISPFQGFRFGEGHGPQGVALGFLISPLRGSGGPARPTRVEQNGNPGGLLQGPTFHLPMPCATSSHGSRHGRRSAPAFVARVGRFRHSETVVYLDFVPAHEVPRSHDGRARLRVRDNGQDGWNIPNLGLSTTGQLRLL